MMTNSTKVWPVSRVGVSGGFLINLIVGYDGTMTTGGPSVRNHLMKFAVPLFVIVVAATAVLFLLRGRAGGPTEGGLRIEVGAVLPDFALTRADGANTTISKVGGKVTLVNFWASWCEACTVEMPSIVKLRDSYQAKGFEVVAVNVDENPAEVLPQMLPQLGIRFPVFIDPEGKLAGLFDVHAIPLTVIMDSSRKILYVESGDRDWNGTEVRSLMDRWLNEQPGK
jgi:thiol-disulfide isomerase/thioredoxin